MFKLKTGIPYGDDMLDTPYPVKFDGDLRSRILRIVFGLGIEQADGVLVGGSAAEFPVIEIPLQFGDEQQSDPALGEAFAKLEDALEAFIAWAYQKLQDKPEIKEQKFRIGRTEYVFDFDWKERDPNKHKSKLDLAPRALERRG